MRRSRFGAAVTAAALIVVALSASTGSAAPSDVAITGVWHKSRCAAASCGAGDPKLKSGDATAGLIQIAVQAKSSLGLSWVRIEARPGTGLWYCITQWDTQMSRIFSARFDWDTYAWTSPTTGSGCNEGVPHFHGDPAANDIYALRVLAHEGGSGLEGASSQFSLRFNNPPKAPQWDKPPVLSGSGDSMETRFSWPPNREPDMVEYAVVRVDPRGATTTLVVDAFRKGGTPCGRNPSGNLECVDDRFGSTSPAGTYRYHLVAYRRSGVSAPSCRSKQVACIASPPSSTQTVRIAGSPGSPATTTPTVGPTASATPTDAPPPIVQPSAIVQTPRLDPSASPSSVAAGDNGPDAGGGSRAVPLGAAATLMILTAALYVRALRGSRSRV